MFPEFNPIFHENATFREKDFSSRPQQCSVDILHILDYYGTAMKHT
jgi:hypothetical protein